MAKKESSGGFAALARQAAETPEILPRVEFGTDKFAEVVKVLEFQEAQPREMEFDDKFSGEKQKAYAINVLDVEDNTPRSLIFRDDPTHGLTRGIGRVFAKHGNLLGVRVRIETKNYNHATYGKTRGYIVNEAPAMPGETPP